MTIALSLPLSAPAQRIHGVVVDPRGAVIVGARVEVECGDIRVIVETDHRGMFETHGGPLLNETCRLSVRQPGFASFQQSVTADSVPKRFELKISRVTQTVSIDENGAPVKPVFAPLNSTSLSQEAVTRASRTTGGVIGYARSVAGSTLMRDSIFVDGVETSMIPSPNLIREVAVNADPLSVKYATADTNEIEITTLPPERRFRMSFGGSALAAGGASNLRSGLDSSSGQSLLSITGPVPRLPMTFSAGGSLNRSARDEPIVNNDAVTAATSTRSNHGLNLGLFYSDHDRFRFSLAAASAAAASRNEGAGGVTLSESAASDRLKQNDARFALEWSGTGYIYNGGASFGRTLKRLTANDRRPGIEIVGSLNAGGAPLSESRLVRTRWMSTHTFQIQRRGRTSLAGVTVSRTADADTAIPNPAGVLRFEGEASFANALRGGQIGTWYVGTGSSHVRYSNLAAAPFLETDLIRNDRMVARAGLRAEYQNRSGTALGPRLSLAGGVRGFVVRAGAGLFVHNWANDFFVNLLRNDGTQTRQYIVHETGLTLPAFPNRAAQSVVSRPEAALSRARFATVRMSLERSFKEVAAGMEYIHTRGLHLPGSRRLSSELGWLDLFTSSGRLFRDEVLAKLSLRWRRHFVTGNYEWLRSFDDTDGPMSFPVDPDDVRAEWARTSALPRHNAGVVGDFALPAAVRLSVVSTFRSPGPYNIISGRDPIRNGLINDRAGGARNSGDGPSFRSVSLSASRRVPVAFPFHPPLKINADLGFELDNAFNCRNYTGYGAVIGSPLFKRPLGTFPGRSFQVWLNFGL